MFALRGARSPLVGRDQQLAAMREVLAHAVDFHAPQLITIIGNQGTGKSRLVAELVARHIETPTRVFHGRAGEGGLRFGVVTSLLRDRFGITEAMTGEAAMAAFQREVTRVFDDQRVAEVLHFLGGFLELGFPDSPFLRVLKESPRQHEEIARTVLRRFIEVDARNSPLVLVLDDLQWADDDSLVVLRELGAGLGGSAVALIACTRPEMLMRCPDWGTGATDHRRIDLRNLEPDDAAAMFANLLSRCGEVPEDIAWDAVEMTGGNPSFLEQLVQLFIENQVIDTSGSSWRLDADKALDIELPISIEEAIEARIAALEPPERAVLEKGAVFGNVFWQSAIVALTRVEDSEASQPPAPADPLELPWTDDDASRRVAAVIDELAQRDYVLKLDAEDSTIPGDVEVVFKHNLERELIARSTESGRLRRYHRLAAQWLETRLIGRSEEQLEFLAQLYERGGDTQQAARCYIAGAEKARLRYANEEAVELYGRGLAMVGEDDVVARMEALHNSGVVLDLVGRTTDAVVRFTDMLQLAWLYDNQAKAGAAHSRLGRICRQQGNYDRAMDHLREASGLFRRAGDDRGIAATLDDIGKVHWLRGAYGQALDFHRQALAIRRALGDRRSIALSLANIGRVHHDSGGFKAAIAQFREALDLRRDIGDLSGVVQSLCDLGGVHTEDGTLEMALELFEEARRIAVDIGDKLALTDVLSRMGECLSVMGRGSEAAAVLEEAIELARSLGDRVALSECSRRLAEVQLGLGELEAAEQSAQRALEISEAVGSRVHIGNAHRVLAEAAAARGLEGGGRERAEEHFRRSVDILAGMKNELELARCYRAFAIFRDRCGLAEDATKLRRRADEIYGRLRGAAAIE